MLQVIGAGFGRTGTHSLGLALEKLGFSPCYNVLQVSKSPEHTALWNNAIDGKKIDWDRLFRDYNSSVEWPTVAFLPQVTQHFHQAKVILTVRESDSWYESAIKTIFNGLELSAYNPDPTKRERSGMLRSLILERTFQSRYRDRDFAIRVYEQHNQRVREMVPSNRLLEFNVKNGWKQLSDFLGKTAPDEPFPRLNVREDFLESKPDWAKKLMREQGQTGS